MSELKAKVGPEQKVDARWSTLGTQVESAPRSDTDLEKISTNCVAFFNRYPDVPGSEFFCSLITQGRISPDHCRELEQLLAAAAELYLRFFELGRRVGLAEIEPVGPIQ